MTTQTQAAKFLLDAAQATLDADYHKAAALTGIAITHLMVAATPLPEYQEEEEDEGLINGRPVSDYRSPIPVYDHDTVLGFLAKNYPERLELIDQVPEATQRDGFWLRNRCQELGVVPIKVEAPRVLQEQGIREVNAYPTHLLARRFID